MLLSGLFVPLLSLLLLAPRSASAAAEPVPDLHPDVLPEDTLDFSQTIPRFMLELLRAGHENRLFDETEQRELMSTLFFSADLYGKYKASASLLVIA
jgi:hypothetical protein